MNDHATFTWKWYPPAGHGSDGTNVRAGINPARNARELNRWRRLAMWVTASRGTPVSEFNDYRDILSELTATASTVNGGRETVTR